MGDRTPHAAATRAGVEAFEAGGTAMDAALPAATTLAVVYPHMCGVGGDLFALVPRSDARSSRSTRAVGVPASIPRLVGVSEVPQGGP